MNYITGKSKNLIAAYHKAPEHIQKIVTVSLEPYIEEKY